MEERDPRGIPPLPPAHVARPRLTSLLDANAAQCMILNAPAGYGKTSLAAEWLRTRDSVAWYAATSESADVAALSAGIADAMSSVVPGAAERLRARLLVASGPEEAVQPLAEILSEDIAGWPDEAVLVLDDYHLVMESGAAERFVDCILTLNPSLRVLIATRQRPTWASARRLLAGDVAELLADVLAMTDAEAGAVLTERPTAAVAELVERAEGWPAVIGLAAVAGSSSLPGIRLSDDLFRYFAEEVFRAADRDVRDLVLLAAIPRTLTVEIASGPLGIESAERRLDHLRALGLASSSTEGVRIHPLLRDFLRHKLRADAPERFAELVRRILEFARDRRLWDEAYEAASTLGEPRTAADVAGEAGPDLLLEGRTETLQRWLERCGPALTESPRAVLAHAELMIRCGRFAEARALALQTARRLSEADGVASRAWRTASQASYFLCKNRDSLNFALEARRLAITPEEAEEAVAQAVSAAADLEATETKDLISALEDANPRTPEGRLRLAQRRVQAAARTGSLAGMEAVLRATQPMQALARDPYVKSGFAACQAYVQYARAAYNVATRLALELERYCTEYRLGFAACVCRLAVARAAAGARDFTAAHAALAEAKSQLDADQDAFNHVAYTCSLMEVLLAEKDVEQAQALDLTTESVAAPASIVGEFYALRALAHAVAANSNAAQRDVATANEFTQGLEASRYADFAQAILSLSEGDRDPAQAQQRILQSIHATASADFAHAFVLAARLRPDLLAVVEGNRPARRFAVDAFMRSGDTTFAAALEPGLHRAKNRIGSLTPRETQVLALLGEACTNADIARRLVIASSTAKVHVRRILEKLGARNRVEAALMSRDVLSDVDNPD